MQAEQCKPKSVGDLYPFCRNLSSQKSRHANPPAILATYRFTRRPSKDHSMKTMQTLLFAVALSLAGTAAFAHGDEHRSNASKAAVKKEQKAWGIAGDAKAAKRTVTLSMTDNMRFTPDKIEVRHGETVKFVMKNEGKLLHEFVIGTKQELDRHAALMMKFPDMEHDEPYMAHVPPGKTGEIIWTFNRAGEFDFACLIAGHYQAGMVGKISVSR
jgi:uncharacterized cupredoxin-like copper-binding protein